MNLDPDHFPLCIETKLTFTAARPGHCLDGTAKTISPLWISICSSAPFRVFPWPIVFVDINGLEPEGSQNIKDASEEIAH